MTDEKTVDLGKPFKYEWFGVGDINGFFGIMFDNVTVLAFLATILIVFFDMPKDIVMTKMFPGTAFGVLVGDLVYSWTAFRLANRTKKHVTAMPLGLDTPSTIGIAFAVLGPAYKGYLEQGMTPHDAGMQTWYLGMATMIYVGIFKTIFSFFGNWLMKVVPQAGLLGSLAGVGLALLGFGPTVEIMSAPVIGMVALGILLYNMVAGIKLPFNIPGVFASVVVGTILYYVLGPLGLAGVQYQSPTASALSFNLPWPSLGFIAGLKDGLQYLPVAIPFAILTVVGGINVTESARLAGDEYDTREVLLVEAIATLVAGVCGGVAQSTPYIGQPAFKEMGSRSGYTILTGLVVGIGGMMGIIGFIVDVIPAACLAPILVFVALNIICQAFTACPAKYGPAVAFAFFPNVARAVWIKINELPKDVFEQTPKFFNEHFVTMVMCNGFILTAMLWGAFLSLMIDRKFKLSACYLLILAFLSFFGIIHSVCPNGNMYLPWHLETAYQMNAAYQFSLGYLVLGVLIFVLSFSKEAQEIPAEPAV
ncbi:MAG: hypothetical protein Q4F00_05315 [bacterium]|nr:hypothetical protein [bacterium]